MPPRGRGRGGGGSRGGISWLKKEEPKFIRQFKERIAYKEQANLETKKKVADDNDLNIEKEEDLPQVLQLESGDLDASEYIKLKNKEEVENAGSSFGKILFKRRKKPEEESEETDTLPKTSEIDNIFNLKDGEEQVEEPETSEETEEVSEKEVVLPKKKLLADECETDIKFGLQPAKKLRFCDRPTSQVTNMSAAKVLAREAKAGNKKLLSFYDEEEDEAEEYNREVFKEKSEKEAVREAEREANYDSDY